MSATIPSTQAASSAIFSSLPAEKTSSIRNLARYKLAMPLLAMLILGGCATGANSLAGSKQSSEHVAAAEPGECVIDEPGAVAPTVIC
jgi:hypothetical protein